MFALLSLACDATIGSDDEVGDSSSTGASEEGTPFEPCSADAPCPDGQFCFNGLCALGCTSDENCSEDQYCDGDSLLCQDDEVSTCSSDDDCGEGQICFEQFCSTAPVDTDCEPWALTMDGCPSDAVCWVETETTQACHTMPACAADDSCPVGLYGAVCNVDYLPDKDEICLIGVCATVEHCPADWFCVRYPENAALGQCGNGSIGALCSKPSECLSGNCVMLLPGLPGFCQ
ncbi:Dickkopf N-terminal cysteine-rich domain-containing protein [Nannocystaceae bacterium ST9]